MMLSLFAWAVSLVRNSGYLFLVLCFQQLLFCHCSKQKSLVILSLIYKKLVRIVNREVPDLCLHCSSQANSLVTSLKF